MTLSGRGVVIFARMSSTRLPGKMLLPVAGRPLLWHLIQRARLVRGSPFVGVATSTADSDDPLADFAASEGVPVYRGSLENVVERGLGAMRAFSLAAAARVCGDRAYLDHGSIATALERLDSGVDLVTNVPNRPSPGMTTEAFTATALERARSLVRTPAEAEHMTQAFYQNAGAFRIVVIPAPNTDGVDLSVDTREQWLRADAVFRKLEGKFGTAYHAKAAWQDIRDAMVATDR